MGRVSTQWRNGVLEQHLPAGVHTSWAWRQRAGLVLAGEQQVPSRLAERSGSLVRLPWAGWKSGPLATGSEALQGRLHHCSGLALESFHLL